MTALPTLVIDFDSTIVRLEGLDELARLALASDPGRDKAIATIEGITRQGMEGTIGIDESLERRLKAVRIGRRHVEEVVKLLRRNISPSFKRLRSAIRRNADRIHVVSSGFREYVEPICVDLGMKAEHIHCNTFTWSKEGVVTGFDRKSSLAKPGGKAAIVRSLKLAKPVVAVGDGATDCEIRDHGAADEFVAYCENVERDSVVQRADRVVRSLDEVLWLFEMPGSPSFPKSRMVALLLENIHPDAAEALRQEGYRVEALSDALNEAELSRSIRGVSLLGIRSKTQVTAKALAGADRLLAVGCFCIGTEQVDLGAASDRGVAVFNAPYSNTRSVVELAIGEIVMLLRRATESSALLHQGTWRKSAAGCREVRGRTLGIVGYGHIGSQLSVLAEALGMQVLFFDLEERLALGNATKCDSLNELLGKADIVTLHVDGRASNRNLIGERQLKRMRQGSLLLNLSRGHIVDIDALARALRSGHIAGAAVDVFPEEPLSNKDPFLSPLRGIPNVILTPHVGGSTAEAQQSIGTFVAARLIEYVNAGNTGGAVNLPPIQLAGMPRAHRFLHLHRNQPGILAAINAILAKRKINILGQGLRTDERVGYVITDVNKTYDSDVIAELKAIPGTIRFRVLY
ncbi:MAG: phosphoglycerate dehydrogenase [Phycisphaerae bacterium]|jgi:D-3-phosphoglycerate dehydrogenase|nr:phosphoglycerate dehydrogenase [Phycisphaerae bacterium]